MTNTNQQPTNAIRYRQADQNVPASPPKTRPTHRVMFSRITGQNGNGNDQLGPTREIGAIWPRKNGKKGGILTLDHVPAELAQHQGVIFTLPIDQDRQASPLSQADNDQSQMV